MVFYFSRAFHVLLCYWTIQVFNDALTILTIWARQKGDLFLPFNPTKNSPLLILKILSLNSIKEHIYRAQKLNNRISSIDDAECLSPTSQTDFQTDVFPTLEQATNFLIDEAMKKTERNITQAAVKK